MKSTAGKGSSPRSIFSDNYRKNYDEIFRKGCDDFESEGTREFRKLLKSGNAPSVLAFMRLFVKYGKSIRFPKNMGETIQGVEWSKPTDIAETIQNVK